MTPKANKSIDILLVEDNPGDVRLIKEVLSNNKTLITVFNVSDGVEAMDYLHHRGRFVSEVRPDLIILDLNLPRKDGREVLQEIKSDDLLKHIPVLVMTISQSEEDIFKSYNLQANCYITKPIDLHQFMKVIKSIEDFWFSIVKLPSKNEVQ